MTIKLRRLYRTPWGIDGTLSINGRIVAHTAEHPVFRLPQGQYPITLDHLLFNAHNGPMKNTCGEISVGQHQCSGFLLNTQETFWPIYNRIQKSLKRGHYVTLIIEE